MATIQLAGETTETHFDWVKSEQLEAMRDVAHDGRHGLRDEAILTPLYGTGRRRSELEQVNQDILDLIED